MNMPDIYEAWEFRPSTAVCTAVDVKYCIEKLENQIDELTRELNSLKGIKQVPALLRKE
jgi:hypothetical protein